MCRQVGARPETWLDTNHEFHWNVFLFFPFVCRGGHVQIMEREQVHRPRTYRLHRRFVVLLKCQPKNLERVRVKKIVPCVKPAEFCSCFMCKSILWRKKKKRTPPIIVYCGQNLSGFFFCTCKVSLKKNRSHPQSLGALAGKNHHNSHCYHHGTFQPPLLLQILCLQ